MRNSLYRRRFAILGAVAILAAVGTPCPVGLAAADAKPAKKDSRPQTRPKEAAFTTSVTPAQARVGDVVTYKVTARLAHPWHIYKYSKVPVDNGPKFTTFDFFDPSGLDVQGDWTASREPTRKKEPAFPEIPFLEYYEDDVTWSIKLKVGEGTSPGKKTLRCQAGYMICSDQNCSFPGQWTLPDAELTVLGGSGEARPRFVSYRPEEAPGTKARPAKKDSRIPMAKVVHLSTEVVPAEAKAGEQVALKVTAKLDLGWHIFQQGKPSEGEGPTPTTFDTFDLGGLTPKGDWSSSKPPTRKKDPNFPTVEAVEFFEDEVTWTLPLLVPPGAEPGPRSLGIQAGFQICDAKLCQRPGQWTLPTPTFAVLPGGGATGAVPVAPAATTEIPTKASDSKPAEVASPARSSKADGPKVVSEIEKTANSGFVAFLLACAGGGLLALAMPCVWPMIPITVNFFVKQGQKDKGKATGLAIAYCLSIIGIFTGLGVLFSVFLGASSLSNLANNPWLNTGVALLFLVFGLSLLGLFEVRLPNFLLNASAQGESRGGLIGVMFMASTLTITSFTCTFPVVGGLLVLAANGNYLYPVIGLATFATVVALPFFVLALAPGMLSKLPRSGDWMNTVKVVGGLVEIGAAFKFVNTAELGFNAVPESAWCDEQALLTIWVVMCLVCGIYLLGLFKTDHDQSDAKVGPVRIVSGMLFLFLSLYLAPALFGQPPSGQIYNRLIVGLLPPKGSETKATSTDPEIAITQEKSKHGVVWGWSYAAALAEARRDKKKILIDFTGVNCSNCRQMERSVMPRADVSAKMGEFVTVALYTDYVPISSITQAQRADLGDKNVQREIEMTGEATAPNYVIVDPGGPAEKVVASLGGLVEPATFLDFLDKGLKGGGDAGSKSSEAISKTADAGNGSKSR